MNLHEQIDRFLNQTPRLKVAVAAACLLAVAGVLGFVYWLGARKAEASATAKYNAETAARDKQIEIYLRNAAQLEGENALLRKQNEVVADALRKADSARTKQNEAELAAIADERTKKYAEIDTVNDYLSQLCAFFDEFKRSGYTISDADAGRCKAAP